MKILGIKLTHDAAVAGIEDGKLKFCVEIEKIDNNPRYSKMWDYRYIEKILSAENFMVAQTIVVDGWKGGAANGNDAENLPVDSYTEFDQWSSGGSPLSFSAGMDICGFSFPYKSYKHIFGHIFAGYCTAPWAKNREPAYCITWDGGMQPRLHRIDPESRRNVEFIATLHELYSFIYGAMGRYFGPFKIEGVECIPVEELDDIQRAGGYDIPGKIMSYIALGKFNKAMSHYLFQCYREKITLQSPDLLYNQSGENEHYMLRKAFEYAQENEISDADALRTIHEFLGRLLVNAAVRKIPEGSNLIFCGGSALNIKWNSMMRDSGHFRTVWVPPFPNDSGNAIGQACAEMATVYDHWDLDWSVYSGPRLILGEIPPNWGISYCSVAELAKLLFSTDQPVIVMNGRSEVGPRALGNRSILMSPASPFAKQHLNHIKKREHFRPVAPIALEEDAETFFEPGTPDPYMLFDHAVSDLARELMPAIVHIDGTARLQTVTRESNSIIYEILTEFKKLSGFGVLCNTSANDNGSGFFPSIGDALAWGGTKYLWNGGTLYTKKTA